ncbi:hypothetical protein Tco_0885627 [Tanacetum coccineum]
MLSWLILFVDLLEVWSLEATCEFSIKSVRQLIDDLVLPKEKVTKMWVKVMPIKINVFAWRVRLDKLPTRLNLSLKEVDIIKKTENQAKMTKLSMEWKRLCKIKAKVQKCQSQSQY